MQVGSDIPSYAFCFRPWGCLCRKAQFPDTVNFIYDQSLSCVDQEAHCKLSFRSFAHQTLFIREMFRFKCLCSCIEVDSYLSRLWGRGRGGRGWLGSGLSTRGAPAAEWQGLTQTTQLVCSNFSLQSRAMTQLPLHAAASGLQVCHLLTQLCDLSCLCLQMQTCLRFTFPTSYLNSTVYHDHRLNSSTSSMLAEET